MPDREAPAAVARLIEDSWQSRSQGEYDGALMSVTDFAKARRTVTLSCGEMRYRDYLATDHILAEFPEHPPPLAVGVHAILLCGNEAIVLRLQNGRLAVPGGAVDAEDLGEARCHAMQHAISREVMEETGLDIREVQLEITGLYVGGHPTHLIAFFLAGVPSDARQAVRTYAPTDERERIRSIGSLPLSQLVGCARQGPLVVRAAARSLFHYRGIEPAWTIET